MKHIILALIATCTLSVAIAADSHDHKPAAGPNGGRVIEIDGGHAEFFVQPDKKVRITILDEENKAVAPAEQKVSLIAETPTGKAKLAFAVADGAFVSDAAIPGGEYRVVLQIRANADAKPQNTRIDYNPTICGECKHPEYACTCTGGGEAHAH
jgi:hypothetical protein